MFSIEYVIYLMRLTKDLLFYGILSTACVSIIGNTIIIMVYQNKVFKNQAIGFFYPAIAFFNTIFLLFGAAEQLAVLYFRLPFIYCQISIFITIIAPLMSSWLMVVVSFDRLALLFDFERLKILKSIRARFICLSVILLLVVSFNLPGVILAKDARKNSTIVSNQCAVDTRHISDFMVIYTIVYTVLYCLVPFLIMFINTIAIYIKVCLLRRRLSVRDTYNDKLKFIHTILVLNIVFLITHLPFSIVISISAYYRVFSRNTLTIYHVIFLDALTYATYLIIWIYYSFACIIHICFNTNFRKCLKNSFIKCFRKI